MRVCIFSINDSYFKIDNEKLFFLNEIKKVADRIIIISTTSYQKSEVQKLEKISEELFWNVCGYNSERWKYVIDELDKNGEIKSIEELMLIDDSCFGPFFPLKDIFDKMKVWDFWGMTVHPPIIPSKCGMKNSRDSHFLQTYFLVFSKKVIQSNLFRDFWNQVRHYSNFSEYESKFEFKLTPFLAQKFSWNAFADTREWESKNNYISYLLFQPYKLIERKQFPLLSKFMLGIRKKISLNYENGEQIIKAISYIESNCDYDIKLIYEYLICRNNLHTLRENLGLIFNIHETGIDINNIKKIKKVAIFAHLYYEDLFNYTLPFLEALSKFCDIYIATDSLQKIKIIKEKARSSNLFHFEINQMKGREWSSYLIIFKKYFFQYEYFCLIHDKKSSQMYFSTVGECFCNNLWENTINSVEYVQKVVDLFEGNEYLGVLVPPVVYHGEYFNTAIDYWTICFEITKQFLEENELFVPLDKELPPVAIGSVYWIRRKALSKLYKIEISETNFADEPMPVDGTFSHMLERAIPYIAQANGYYTGTIINDTYVKINLLNYQEMLNGILKRVQRDTNFNLTTYEESQKNLIRKKNKRELLIEKLFKSLK